MFAFLQKKIAVPAQSVASACAWDFYEGWLAIGASEGFLKLIKLDSMKVQGNSSQGNESADLPNHSGNISLIVWNDKYRKLTTCDSTGTIIVFMKHNGQWVEEMVNNRKASSVKDMKWSPDGTKICIAYLDGNVIVGGVEGNRKWGKEYPIQIQLICWSPSSKELLIGTVSGEVYMYDENGDLLHQIRMQGLQRVV